MSQPEQISLNELKEWLKRETASLIEPMKDKSTSLLQETQGRINDVIESNQKILENSQREMKKNIPKTYRFSRNANKFAENLARTIEATRTPEQVSYDSLQAFYNGLSRVISVTEQLRREAYPYITPYFIFDRRRLDATLKRLQDINYELGDFLTNKYLKAKTVEDASGMVDKLIDTLNHMNETENEREKTKQLENSLQAKLQETQQEIAQVQTKAELTNLLASEERIKELRGNVKDNLRYLQKPFFKLLSRSKSGEVAIPVDEVKKLGDYLSDPFEALATEDEGYPTIRSILKKLSEAMDQKKLKLKSTRLRKAQEQIYNILNNDSFNTLYKNCKEALSLRNKMLDSNAITTLQSELTELQNQLKELQKENEFARARDTALENEHKKLKDKIEIHKKELEKTVFQLTNRNIQVVFTQPE